MAGFRVVGEDGEHIVAPRTSSTKPCSAFFGSGRRSFKVRLTDLEKMLRKA
jgi:hypothetical protein